MRKIASRVALALVTTYIAIVVGATALAQTKVNGNLVNLIIAAGKILTFNNTLTFSGTDGSTLNVGPGGNLTGVFNTTGALKSNGSGTVSQAACADLSNAGTGCAAAVTAVGTAAAGQIPATQTNDTACSTCVGYIQESSIPSGSAVVLSSGVTNNITTLSLAAGDWTVCANVYTFPNTGTTTTLVQAAINTANAFPAAPGGGASIVVPLPSVATQGVALAVGCRQVLLSGTTTVYLMININFAVSTLNVGGDLWARRAR